jgi:hypothetical protein
MKNEHLSDLVEEFNKVYETYSTEGNTGVKNLCRIANAIGYKDTMYFGQFHQNGSYGDLINFLEDNPGAVDAVKEWIIDQNCEEWRDNILSHLPESEEED